MRKALTYRLFGWGAIPKRVRPVLESEGIVVVDEGMRGWFVAKNVKGPGKRYVGRMAGFSGCLAITKKRIMAFSYGKRQMNISVDDPKLANLYVDLPKLETLSISFESSLFHPEWKGILEFRFKTEKAAQFHDLLRSLGAQEGHAGRN